MNVGGTAPKSVPAVDGGLLLGGRLFLFASALVTVRFGHHDEATASTTSRIAAGAITGTIG